MKRVIELYVMNGAFSKKLVYDATNNRGNRAMKNDIVNEVNSAYAFTISFYVNDSNEGSTQVLPADLDIIPIVHDRINAWFDLA